MLFKVFEIYPNANKYWSGKFLHLYCMTVLKTNSRNMKKNSKPLQVFATSSLLCLNVAVFRPTPVHRKYENKKLITYT